MVSFFKLDNFNFEISKFFGYEFKTPIKHPSYDTRHGKEDIWSNIMRNGILVTSCTESQLESKKNETLIFRIHKSVRIDIKKLNIQNCYRGNWLRYYLLELQD